MMVASMAGRRAPGISRPPVVLRSSCSGVLHRAAVSVRGLAGTSCMDSTLRILRPLSGTGVGSHTQCSVASSSSMLRGCAVGLGADREGLLVRGHVWQRHNCKGGIRCEAAAASSAEGTGSGPDANASPAPDVNLAQKVRAFCFYLTTFAVAIPLFVVMLVIHPFVLLFDKNRRRVHHLVNKVWATLTTSLFYKTEIEGWENLPAADEGAVYVANHQSFLDIYTLFLLGRPFKFISKTSNFLIPIIGWSMYLTGHIPLQRMDSRSQLDCLKTCVRLVKEGVSVLFFPEGTRTTDGAMAAFKKGAFSVAAKGGVPVVPIALIGSGKLMPNGLEYTLRPGVVKMIVLPPIRSKSSDELCNESRKAIAETLIKHGYPVH